MGSHRDKTGHSTAANCEQSVAGDSSASHSVDVQEFACSLYSKTLFARASIWPVSSSLTKVRLLEHVRSYKRKHVSCVALRTEPKYSPALINCDLTVGSFKPPKRLYSAQDEPRTSRPTRLPSTPYTVEYSLTNALPVNFRMDLKNRGNNQLKTHFLDVPQFSGSANCYPNMINCRWQRRGETIEIRAINITHVWRTWLFTPYSDEIWL